MVSWSAGLSYQVPTTSAKVWVWVSVGAGIFRLCHVAIVGACDSGVSPYTPVSPLLHWLMVSASESSY